jgi:cephalosporin hydroxylase
MNPDHSRERQFAERFERYHSDKGIHNYAPVYASLPPDLASIFEIGVYWGGSVLTSLEMFPDAEVWGLDINVDLLNDPKSCWLAYPIDDRLRRTHIIEGDLRTFKPLDRQWDLIIDDGTHELDHVLALWDRMHRQARRFYIIEDLYLSRLMPVWERVTRDVPTAQVIFWRTSDHCGDSRLAPDSDSHCLIVKFPEEG